MVSVDILKQFPLFAGVDGRVLRQIAQACSTRTYQANELCFSEGEKAENFYLLLRGKISLERQLPLAWLHRVATIHTLGEKEVFGWSALVETSVLTASARCLESSEVIYIKGKELLDILERNSRASYLVMKRLAAIVASRLTDTSKQLLREMAEFESYRTM